MEQRDIIQELPSNQRVTFDQLAALGSEVRLLFSRLGIPAIQSSVLDTLLRNVDKLSARWHAGNAQSVKEMIGCTTAMRVIEAILAAQGDSGAMDCYQRIAKKDVDLFSPTRSQGKDALWELQLLKVLKSRGMVATLVEPDINVVISGMIIPIACKKIYSIKNLEGQLRSAGTQLKKIGMGGIAALNIDAQLPQDHLIVASSTREASNVLVGEARRFLEGNQSLIRRMIKAGKFDAVLVSASCPMDNVRVRPRFNVGTESLLWCPAGYCSDEGNVRTELFRGAMKLPMLVD